MAQNSAALPHELQQGQLTRRQLIQGLTFAAAATTIGTADAGQVQAGDASAKVRATLETLVRDTPEIGLQVAAYLNGKLVVDALREAPGKPPVYLLETRLDLVTSPLTLGLHPAAPAATGVFGFDAATLLPTSNQTSRNENAIRARLTRGARMRRAISRRVAIANAAQYTSRMR